MATSQAIQEFQQDKLGGLLFHQQQIRELKPAGRSVAVLRYLHQLVELQQQSLQMVQQHIQQPEMHGALVPAPPLLQRFAQRAAGGRDDARGRENNKQSKK